MTWELLIQLITNFGPLLIFFIGLGWFIVRLVWPFWADKVWPEIVVWKAAQHDVDRREADALHAIARVLEKFEPPA